MCSGDQNVYGNFSAQLFCKLKTALKCLLIFFKYVQLLRSTDVKSREMRQYMEGERQQRGFI